MADTNPESALRAQLSRTAEAGRDSITGGEDVTISAPSFRPLMPTAHLVRGDRPPNLPEPGERLEDFELLRVLGQGSFARVFLARQLSLGRLVALKVSANRGNEARTLASLEHTHIVQVFLERVDETRGLRLLCMQYVPGTTLERVVTELAADQSRPWSGRAFVEVLDGLGQLPPPFDPTALRDRELLAAAGWPEAVCWLGGRLAEALAYAHRQGVLHRDIKPANVLVNQYGRPLLADFNIALDPHRVHGAAGAMFGGTLAYMAPEHIDAVNPDRRADPAAVDERSDLYGLGVVLYELLTGRLPSDDVPLPDGVPPTLGALADQRRAGAPSPRRSRPETPEVIDRVVRRCLDPRPDARYQTGAELAEALDGCRELEHIRQELPVAGPLTRAALRHPFLWMALLALLPQLVGSLVNISYNAIRIVQGLTEGQQQAFHRLVFVYNLVAYPLGFWVLYRLIVPPFQLWSRLRRFEPVEEACVAQVRRGVLTWPGWMLAMSCLCWLPGGLLFPLGIHLLAGPVPLAVFGHFAVSFTISGLIALTYSFFGVEFVVVRVLYPRLWADPRQLHRQMASEIGSFPARLQLMQLLAGTIPLAAAILMVMGGATFAESLGYRLLVAALILLGMAGFGLAVLANSLLRETLAVLRRNDLLLTLKRQAE